MKNFVAIISLILILSAVSLPLYAVSASVETLFLDPDKNEILALTDEIVKKINEVIDEENYQRKTDGNLDFLSLITENDIDFSNMYKTYSFADEILIAESEDEVQKILSECPYRWTLLTEHNGIVIETEIYKWCALDREMSDELSAKERNLIYMEHGDYRVGATAISTNASFYKKATQNGKFTYFVTLPSIYTSAALQIRNNKCYVICQDGDASGAYYNANRIEVIKNENPRLMVHGPQYKLSGFDIPWAAVITPIILIGIVTLSITVKKTYKRLKT